MNDDRLSAGMEASALLHRAEALGGFGTVLHKGDAMRGSLLLLVLQRGVPVTFLERVLSAAGSYRWQRSGTPKFDSQWAAQYVARRQSRDPDCWILELDIPLSERFIAETTTEG